MSALLRCVLDQPACMLACLAWQSMHQLCSVNAFLGSQHACWNVWHATACTSCARSGLTGALACGGALQGRGILLHEEH
jgi:hypothetical protein